MLLYLFYSDGETTLAACDLTGGFSDLEMTWLLYCAGAATVD